MAPLATAATKATNQAGWLRMAMATRSPLRTPKRVRSCAARRSTRAKNWAKVARCYLPTRRFARCTVGAPGIQRAEQVRRGVAKRRGPPSAGVTTS